MELSSLFFTELNSTLGHLSSSIKKVSTYGAITPTPGQLCLVHRTTSPAHHTAPQAQTNQPDFVYNAASSLPEDYYLPDKLHCFYPTNMNKQALCFLLGAESLVK